MSDQYFDLSNLTGLTENGAASSGSSKDTGDLRRRYNFGNYIHSLRIKQDPFFRLASLYRKRPTDDPEFKFTEERDSWHRRYAYVVAHSNDGSTWTTADATVNAADIAQGSTWYVKMKTDYKNSGNIGPRYGNSSSSVSVGDSGTMPKFFLVNQIVKINFGSAYNSPSDYILGRITAITEDSANETVELTLYIVRTLNNSSNTELQWASATAPMTTTYGYSNADVFNGTTTVPGLESKRAYVVGTSFTRGSGYPESWMDQPYSTGYGQTQIWKTTFGMDYTTMATVLKLNPNEFARVWGKKMLEHKWDIENDLWFSTLYTDSAGYHYTQGILDYVLNYGQIYDLDLATKTLDDFLDDMSQYFDPRNDSATGTIFFADTRTYNWLNKLSGFFSNNVSVNSQFRGDFSFVGRANIGGVDVNKIETNYGTMNIVRDIHLDGSGVSIVGVNMNNVEYRPLVGNGYNRDTTVYVGVQKIETTGYDRFMSLIQTEAGLQLTNPELFAIWK